MGILAWRFFADYVSNTNAIIALSIGYCSLYGLSDEWHQSFVPGREADFLDWLADTLGALAAALTIQLKNKLFKSRKYTD